MTIITELNPHDRPPSSILQKYKACQKLSPSEIALHKAIIDPQKLDPHHLPEGVTLQRWMSSEHLRQTFDEFVQGNSKTKEALPVFTHQSVSGLQIIPSLFPASVQSEILSRLFHRDLSNRDHQTNLHLHYNITYPSQHDRIDPSTAAGDHGDPATPNLQLPSFFEDCPIRKIYPKDPCVHRPITVRSMLGRKLRWATLGGQYNWTDKAYPPGRPPQFPTDIAAVLRAAFPEIEAQAAILNIYSTGDTLSPHRDVSEECDIGLISVSFGCDGLFLISHDDGVDGEIIRLRSGDTVYMNGSSRFAWHGVPKVVPGTCPDWLSDWPCTSDEMDMSRFEAWRGWMSGKRVNLNVRQMTLQLV